MSSIFRRPAPASSSLRVVQIGSKVSSHPSKTSREQRLCRAPGWSSSRSSSSRTRTSELPEVGSHQHSDDCPPPHPPRRLDGLSRLRFEKVTQLECLEKALLITSTLACQGRRGDYLTMFHLTTVSKKYRKQEAVLADRPS